jgi:hypothetical protein
MGRLKHLVILSLVVLVAVFVAAPGALAKKQLSEDEMDLVTAAGQPKIIQSGTGTIIFTDSPVNTINLASQSQTTLTALVVNNLAGEVQVANALNILSGNTNSPSQANTITQSWGATKDWTAATVAGVTATATATANASATCGKCGIVRGGTATATATANAQPGQILALTKYADQIVESVEGDVFVEQDGVQTLNLESGSQTSLSALLVNNIVGLSQVANAVNITSSFLLFNTGGTGGVVEPNLQVHAQGALTQGTVQTNVINQFRGTPYSRPAPPTAP